MSAQREPRPASPARTGLTGLDNPHPSPGDVRTVTDDCIATEAVAIPFTIEALELDDLREPEPPLTLRSLSTSSSGLSADRVAGLLVLI
jgi:hypothetical protein